MIRALVFLLSVSIKNGGITQKLYSGLMFYISFALYGGYTFARGLIFCGFKMNVPRIVKKTQKIGNNLKNKKINGKKLDVLSIKY